jgi:hypothetical protein
MRQVLSLISLVLLAGSSLAAPRERTILLGPWRIVDAQKDSGDRQPVKVRDLVIDGKLREHTAGAAHEVTDRIFVVRRAYRVNDALPEETKKPVQWIWRLGGWISVDRQTGRITQVNLPAFDEETSETSWYRDYAAYCGASDDGSKSYMLVSQVGRRKAIVRKEFSGPACAAPKWERTPSRVTFVVAGEKTSFIVHEHTADLQPDTVEEENQL